MTVKNALKKLAKFGTIQKSENQAWAVKNGWVVSFRSNGEWREDNTIVCERARRSDDHDDIQSDYSAGSYFDTLTQAIKFAEAEREINP